MKRKLTLILLALPMILSAQTVLTYATHGMQEGDALKLNKLTDINAGNGGANQIWDFSNAKAAGTSTIDYNANPMAKNVLGKAFACLMDDNTTVLHSISDKAKLYYGLSTDNAKIEFEKPITELTFPFGYQSQVSGDMKGTYNDLMVGKKYTIDGLYSVTADGYGTLILPNGIVLSNVLRVIYVKDYTQDMGSALYQITVKHYLFYAAESRYPVLQIKDAKISCDCGCNSNELTACYNPNVTATVVKNTPKLQTITEIAPEFNYTIYPNPVETELRIDYDILENAKIKISILDLSGKKVKTVANLKQELGAYSTTANVETLTNGTYVLEMQVNDKVYTEIFIKQ